MMDEKYLEYLQSIDDNKMNVSDNIMLGTDFSLRNGEDQVHIVEGHPQGIKTKVGIFNHDT